MLLVREIILQLENLSSPFLRNISQLTLLHERTENQISCVSKKKKTSTAQYETEVWNHGTLGSFGAQALLAVTADQRLVLSISVTSLTPPLALGCWPAGGRPQGPPSHADG